MNNIRRELYDQYKESLSMSIIHKNKLIDTLNSNDMYIALNSDYNEDYLDPMIIPIMTTDFICFQIFESKDVLDEYIKENNLEGKLLTRKINKDIFYMIIQDLFLRGVTGVLLNCKLDGAYKTMYYSICELVEYEKNKYSLKRLYTKKKENLIKLLNYMKLKNKQFFYIYREDLSAQEVCFYIVKFHIFHKNSNSVKLFTTEEEANNYCKKHNILKSDEPRNTTIHNDLLFGSLYHLGNKVEVVEIYDNENYYKIPLVEFLELVAGVGYQQIDLSGK